MYTLHRWDTRLAELYITRIHPMTHMEWTSEMKYWNGGLATNHNMEIPCTIYCNINDITL